MRERGYDSKLLARTAGEGGPSLKALVGEGSAAFQRTAIISLIGLERALHLNHVVGRQ